MAREQEVCTLHLESYALCTSSGSPMYVVYAVNVCSVHTSTQYVLYTCIKLSQLSSALNMKVRLTPGIGVSYISLHSRHWCSLHLSPLLALVFLTSLSTAGIGVSYISLCCWHWCFLHLSPLLALVFLTSLSAAGIGVTSLSTAPNVVAMCTSVHYYCSFHGLLVDIASVARGIESVARLCSFQQDMLEQLTASMLQDYSGILHAVPVSGETVCVCVGGCGCGVCGCVCVCGWCVCV